MARLGHVLLHVAHAAVGEEYLLAELRMRGQGAQVGNRRRRQGAARALERVHRLVRAPVEAEEAGTDEVVVARDRHHPAPLQQLHAGVGIGVVAHEVSHAHDAVHIARVETSERRFQRLAIAVDVA